MKTYNNFSIKVPFVSINGKILKQNDKFILFRKEKFMRERLLEILAEALMTETKFMHLLF